MRFLRLIFIYRFGLFIALLPGVRPGFDASCLKILFGFPRYSDCRWRFIDRRRSLHRGIRAAALALPCVSCRIIAARGRRSNRPHIGSAGICGCRCRSCRMELPDHRFRSALRKSWPNSPPVPLAADSTWRSCRPACGANRPARDRMADMSEKRFRTPYFCRPSGDCRSQSLAFGCRSRLCRHVGFRIGRFRAFRR